MLPSSENDNVIIVPRPADLVEGISQRAPYLAKPVKGRLPELHLYPLMEGPNEPIWSGVSGRAPVSGCVCGTGQVPKGHYQPAEGVSRWHSSKTAQVAEWLGWSPDKVTERQADLTRITEAASTSIRRMCGRAFEPVTEARTFSPTMLRWEVLVGDVSAVTAVEVRSAPQNAYTALEQADYETLRSSNREDWPDDTLVRTDGAWFYPGAERFAGDGHLGV